MRPPEVLKQIEMMEKSEDIQETKGEIRIFA